MVVDDRQAEFIQRAVDGELSETESAKLHEILAQSEEARQLHARLIRIAQMNDSTQMVAPPGDLKSNVMRSIDPERYKRISFAEQISRIADQFRTLWSPRMAFGMVTGLILGIGLSAVIGSGPVSPSDRTSTSGALVRGANPAQQTRVFEDDITAERVAGRLSVDRAQQMYSLHLSLDSDVDATVELTYDVDAWTVRSVEQDGRQTTPVNSTPGLLRIEHSGENDYIVGLEALSDSPNALACMVITEGDVVLKEIEVNRP